MKVMDTSCLICFFTEIDYPSILFRWFDRGHELCIPHEVFLELADNHKTKEKVYGQIDSKKIAVFDQIEKRKLDDFKKRHPILGKGEIATILKTLEVSKYTERCYAVLDDGKARGVAAKYEINFTGSYGLVKALKDKSIISVEEFENIKDRMRKSKFRVNFKEFENAN